MSYPVRVLGRRHTSEHSPLFRSNQHEDYASRLQSYHHNQNRGSYSTSSANTHVPLTSGLANIMPRRPSNNPRPGNRVEVRPWAPSDGSSHRIVDGVAYPPQQSLVMSTRSVAIRLTRSDEHFDALQVASHTSHPRPATQFVGTDWANGTILNYDSVPQTSVRAASDHLSHGVSDSDYFGIGARMGNPYVTPSRGGSEIGWRRETKTDNHLPLQPAPLDMVSEDTSDLWNELHRLGPEDGVVVGSTIGDFLAPTPIRAPIDPETLPMLELPSERHELDLTPDIPVGGLHDPTTSAPPAWEIPHSEGVTPSATLATYTSATAADVHDELYDEDGFIPLEALVPPSRSLQIQDKLEDDEEVNGSMHIYGYSRLLTSEGDGQEDIRRKGFRVLGWSPPSSANEQDQDDEDACSEGDSPPPRRGTRRRKRVSTRSSPRHKRTNEVDYRDSESDSGDESDIYQPSRSASLSPSASESSETSMVQPKEGNGRARRSTAVTGSAALALVASKQRVKDYSSDEFSDSGFRSRKRKNSVIPVPVPVPNLTKKSRGRKVPTIPVPMASSSGTQDEEACDSDDEVSLPPRKRKKRGEILNANGERNFVCPECGKCFIRGEHLKRHVRSIHTHDKPHACPFKGCKKSFSRRDNLGQHVRVHLP